MKIRNIVLVSVALVGLSCICIAVLYVRAVDAELSERKSSDMLAQDAKRHLYIGMTRDEALSSMEQAWRHYECDNGRIDGYVFGSHNLDWANIVFLRFEPEGDTLVLTQIAKEESHRLNLYQDCKMTEK